jgi:hypothetical protein
MHVWREIGVELSLLLFVLVMGCAMAWTFLASQ